MSPPTWLPTPEINAVAKNNLRRNGFISPYSKWSVLMGIEVRNSKQELMQRPRRSAASGLLSRFMFRFLNDTTQDHVLSGVSPYGGWVSTSISNQENALTDLSTHQHWWRQVLTRRCPLFPDAASLCQVDKKVTSTGSWVILLIQQTLSSLDLF